MNYGKLTDRELDKAITRAHREGESRLAYDLDGELKMRRAAAADRRDVEATRRPDDSRRSFKG